MKISFKKYFFIILFFSLFLLLCMNTQCFATTCIDEIPQNFTAFNGNDYSVSASHYNIVSVFNEKNVSHYIILSQYKDGGQVSLSYVGFNDSIVIDYNADGSFIISFNNNSLGLEGSGYHISYDGKNSIGDNGWKESIEFSADYEVIHCCDCMMQYQDNFSSDFFGRPLQVGQGVLPQIIQVIPLGRVMKEMKVMIPVVLVTIVGLIGLRKALAFLQKVFRRS